jgi:hypothetical protein
MIRYKGLNLNKSISEETTFMKTRMNKDKTCHDKIPMMYEYMTDMTELTLMHQNYSITDCNHEVALFVWNF